MKSMKDKSMDMKAGKPKSEGFFPEGSKVKVLPKAGEVRGMNYPDTQAQVLGDQNKFIKDINKSKSKPGYRH